LYDRVMAKAPHKTSLKDHPHSDVIAG